MQLNLFGRSKKKAKNSAPATPDHSESNLLAKQVVAYARLHAKAVAYRISYGYYVDDKGRRRATGQTPGLPDVWAIINGRPVGIEIKIGKDTLKPDQLDRMREFKQCGALFWIINDFKTFKQLFDDLYRCD